MDQAPHLSEITEQIEHDIDGGSLAWDLNLGDNTLNAYAAAQGIARKSYYGAGRDPDAYGRTSDATVNGGLQYVHRFDRLWFLPATFTAGAEYNYNHMHDSILAYDRDMEQTVRILGAYLQNEWSDRRFGLLLGLRMDKHNLVEVPVLRDVPAGRAVRVAPGARDQGQDARGDVRAVAFPPEGEISIAA